MPEDLTAPSSLSASIENFHINPEDPCFRIEPYPNSCACFSHGCASLRNAEQIRAWEEQDKNQKEKS